MPKTPSFDTNAVSPDGARGPTEIPGPDPLFSAKPPLLVIDDEPAIRLAMGRMLSGLGHPVEVAATGTEAIGLLARRRYALVVCDVRMPGMTGIEVARAARELDQDLPVIMLSAMADAETATQALRAGAVDYIVKPIEHRALVSCVMRALAVREVERRRRIRAVSAAVMARTAALEQQQRELREQSVRTAESLLRAMQAKDPYLQGHAERLSTVAMSVAETMGLDAATISDVGLAARLADVGMIGTRESVLHKPGPLTTAEYDHVQDHVRTSLEILSPLEHLGRVLDYVRDHHEHYDGTGYPQSLSGDAISIGGRIVSAADAFVALTSRRSYRPSLTADEAVARLGGDVERLLDPAVYTALVQVVASGVE